MRTLPSLWCVAVLSLAACGGNDYPSEDNNNDDPDPDAAPRVDADPNAPDAALPDADPNAPDASGEDVTEPVITFISPLSGELRAGVVEIRIQIDDDRPEEELEVEGLVANVHPVVFDQVSADEWAVDFDTRQLAGWVYPTVVVHATDVAGNRAEQGLEFALDNRPPQVSLDPGYISYFNDNDGVCSDIFDPVGFDAVDDGETVAQLFSLRARIDDQGNTGTAAEVVYIPESQVDQNSAYLAMLDDTTQAVVVDLDGDGFCDALNPELLPGAGAPEPMVVVQLGALEPGGAVFYGPGTLPPGCPPGDDEEYPDSLCDFAQSTVWISDRFSTDEPAIYSPPTDDEAACGGLPVDMLAAAISDGWMCAAAVVADNLGNVNVSPPLRVCVDANGNEDNGCGEWGDIQVGPDCTGTWDAANEVVNNDVPCDPRYVFGDLEILRR
jgi:hypothetical protein